MFRSTERILTTHAGSLPRPTDLLPLVKAQEAGTGDNAVFDAAVRSSVEEVVRKQAGTGVDLVNDGEMSKPSYATYVNDRLSGFDGEGSLAHVAGKLIDTEYPDALEQVVARFEALASLKCASCDGPIRYEDMEPVRKDIENLQAAGKEAGTEHTFMTAASPGVVSMWAENRHYPSEEEYLEAIATAMRQEYEAIAGAGILLQLDCPDLAVPPVGTSLADFRQDIALRVEAINHAVENIPAEAMRMHVCWGNESVPRKNDVGLKDIIDILLKAKPAGLMVMAANGRHEHEWKLFETVKLPDGKYLIPGVIDTTTNVIEHPEVVAQRLGRYAAVVGRENLMAGTDCGFGTVAGMQLVAPSVAWAKLGALSEGALLASRELWSA